MNMNNEWLTGFFLTFMPMTLLLDSFEAIDDRWVMVLAIPIAAFFGWVVWKKTKK